MLDYILHNTQGQRKVHIKGQIKNSPGLWSLLPDIRRGTHEHIIEQEEASLLGFDDFTALIVDRLHHVVWADQVAAAIAQKLRDGDESVIHVL